MPFEFAGLSLPGPIMIEPRIFDDGRGHFLELYKYSDFAAAGIGDYLVQDNFSQSVKGVLRGLHYQLLPKAQGKLVICISGAIYDVAADIRRGSPNFGKWAGLELSKENRRMLYVPPGFAHGFQVLSETAEVMYKCTDEYSPAHERGIIWNDPDIGVAWPLAVPLLSAKDEKHPPLKDADNNFVYEV